MTLGAAMMSSSFVAVKTPALHETLPPKASRCPRRPASHVRDTTYLSGGSDVRKLLMRQGAVGSAQPSSSGVGARLASE